MKNVVQNIGSLVLFYGVIIFGVILLNIRFNQLNNINQDNFGGNSIRMHN